MTTKKKLTGIMSEGYGIIPKKLMKMQFSGTIGKQKGRSVKLVLSYLLSFSGAGNFAFPGLSRICKDLEISRPAAIDALKNAEILGLITIERNGKGKGNVYILDFLTSDFTEEKEESYSQSGKLSVPLNKCSEVNSVDQGSKLSLLEVVNSVYPNNNNNKNNNNTTPSTQKFNNLNVKEKEKESRIEGGKIPKDPNDIIIKDKRVILNFKRGEENFQMDRDFNNLYVGHHAFARVDEFKDSEFYPEMAKKELKETIKILGSSTYEFN